MMNQWDWRKLIVVLSSLGLLLCGATVHSAHAQEQAPVFSGPQPGEAIAPFKIKLAFEDKTVDPVTEAEGKPVMLMFVHELTRPSIATVRALSKFVELRKADLQGAVVFLSNDLTSLQQRLNRARRALPSYPAVGMSVDGEEGPGAYGLNRNVTLTIIIAKDNKVAANFALHDTSVAVDVPKMVEAACKVIGGTPPKLNELMPQMAMRRDAASPQIGGLLRSVIRKDASKEDVDAAAQKVEKIVKRDRAAARQLGEILDRIVHAGRLQQYGTEHAQTYLKKWHKQYGGGQQGKRKRGQAQGKRDQAKP